VHDHQRTDDPCERIEPGPPESTRGQQGDDRERAGQDVRHHVHHRGAVIVIVMMMLVMVVVLVRDVQKPDAREVDQETEHRDRE